MTITRNSINGVTGKGICHENQIVLKLNNNMLKLINSRAATGGINRGFLKSQRDLSDSAIEKLKEDFINIYNNESNKVVLLNRGLEFQDAVASATEMQMSEIYKQVSNDIGEVLQVPENIRNNTASDDEFRNVYKFKKTWKEIDDMTEAEVKKIAEQVAKKICNDMIYKYVTSKRKRCIIVLMRCLSGARQLLKS